MSQSKLRIYVLTQLYLTNLSVEVILQEKKFFDYASIRNVFSLKLIKEYLYFILEKYL